MPVKQRTVLVTSASGPANEGVKHTNLSGFVNVSRLDTNLAPLGVDDTRTVGTDET